MQDLRVPDPNMSPGRNLTEDYLYLLTDTDATSTDGDTDQMLLGPISQYYGYDEDSPDGVHQQQVTIPEFALDSDFFDFLYTVYETEQVLDASLRKDILDIVDKYRLRAKILDKQDQIGPTTLDEVTGEQMDTQGLLWQPGQRDRVVCNRMNTFASYTHLCQSISDASREVNVRASPNGAGRTTLMEFDKFFARPQLKLVHFQLRNLMTNFTENQVYYVSSKPETDSAGLFVLGEDGNVTESVFNPDSKISMLSSAKDNYVVAGSFDGPVSVIFPHREQWDSWQISQETNRIINYVLVSKCPSNLASLMVAANDKTLTQFDMAKGKATTRIKFEDPINCIAENPNDANELLLVGDSRDSLIIDKRQSNRCPVHTLTDHYDYSFACDWHDHKLATGNQDSTVRLYDDRYLSGPPVTLSGFYSGAVRNLAFGQKHLAFAESIDNVYVVDPEHPEKYQVIDFFGKVAGLGFDECDGGFGERLTIGVSDSSVGGILQYKIDGGARDADTMSFI